jgi:hypothetical protein
MKAAVLLGKATSIGQLLFNDLSKLGNLKSKMPKPLLAMQLGLLPEHEADML